MGLSLLIPKQGEFANCKLVKQMRYLFWLFLCMMFSCSSYSGIDGDCPDYIVLKNQIQDEHIRYMKNKYGARVAGSGGALMHNVKELYLCFEIDRTVTIDQAREIYVDATEDILARINRNEKIRPDLDHYPFSAKGIKTQLVFNKIDPSHPIKDQVELMGMGRAVVYFDVKKNGVYEDIYTEPYEEAKRIVMVLK